MEGESSKKVMTVEEAAKYLAVHKDTLYGMLHRPDGSDAEIPHFHVGKGNRSIRIFRELLDVWIINGTEGLPNNELIAFRRAYINNVGRDVVERQTEVTHV